MILCNILLLLYAIFMTFAKLYVKFMFTKLHGMSNPASSQ